MRFRARLLASGVALLSFALASGSLAQNAPTAPPAPAAQAAPQGTSGAPAAGTATPAAPARPARPMDEQPGVPRPRAQRGTTAHRPKAVATPSGPIATYPGFRVLQDGKSRVWVEVDRKVEVTEHKAQGQVVYRLKGASAPTRTNRLPLITGWFASPVGRVQLVDQGADLDLVIELRAAAEATHKILDTEGGMLLLVEFPKVEGLKLAGPIAPGNTAVRASRKRTTQSTSIDGTGAY